MAREGEDDAATAILCDVLARLHQPHPSPPRLTPLEDWFAGLWPFADDPRLVDAVEIARTMLSRQSERVVLHGDMHHGNALDFGARGWLAIDPKHIEGDRAFDYANIFTNPDLDDPQPAVATRPDVFGDRLIRVSTRAGLERGRLLRWIVAETALSAAWFLADGLPAQIDLTVMSRALEEIAQE